MTFIAKLSRLGALAVLCCSSDCCGASCRCGRPGCGGCSGCWGPSAERPLLTHCSFLSAATLRLRWGCCSESLLASSICMFTRASQACSPETSDATSLRVAFCSTSSSFGGPRCSTCLS